MKAVLELSAVILMCLFIYVGIEGFHLSPDTLLVLLAVFIRLAPKVYNTQYSLQLLAVYLPSFERTEAMMGEASAFQEMETERPVRPFFRESPAIELRDLTVSYEGHHVVRNFSLNIPRNSTVGIIGASGAGKSTLVDCLMGLIRPSGGTICLNSQPLEAYSLRGWRASIGYVTQETILFHDSILENLRWGNHQASTAEIVAAAQKAHAHEFIVSLPQGYDTIVGDRGVRLSGGQRQRLALARALMGPPALLILDEATSALDSASEKEVMDAIRDLSRTITIIMIAHRLSTVRNADKIVIIESGVKVEEGSWDDLMTKDSRLSQMWRLQSGQRA